MRIESLKIRNYRTLENLDLNFPSSYSAICGANDSGKTNVVRAIRVLMGEDTRAPWALYSDYERASIKEDFPKWKELEAPNGEISCEVNIALDHRRDIGFYDLVVKQLSIKNPTETLRLSIQVRHRADRPDPITMVKWNEIDSNGKEVPRSDSDIQAQQVLKKLRSSRGILFHDSTKFDSAYLYGPQGVVGHIREITGQHQSLISKMQKTVNKGLSKISRVQQLEFEGLLGRLQTKYKVGLSMPAFDFNFIPFNITLGDRKIEVPLDEWGSGTRNRTLVLMALFRAKQIGDSETSAEKITPIIVIEEPESYLHPSAQAEFGRILQDLAEEFKVQVIVTTHSPYLLNLRDPVCNILLRRHVAFRQVRGTERVDTSGENWMAPFGQSLGLETDEFKPWKELLITNSDSLLLVEGETDREYFEMLKDAAHGNQRLLYQGEIVPYEGTGNLENTVLLRFIRNRYPKFFVTYDLDSAAKIEKKLAALGLEKGKQYQPVGVNIAGKRRIEGLVPEKITAKVYSDHPNLVTAATDGDKDEQRSAKSKLKKLILEEFKKQAAPGNEFFSQFYALAKIINHALK